MATGTTAVWRPGFQRFALEPKFVPRPGATAEDDGWLLSVVFHSGGLQSGAWRAAQICAYLHIMHACTAWATGPFAVWLLGVGTSSPVRSRLCLPNPCVQALERASW